MIEKKVRSCENEEVWFKIEDGFLFAKYKPKLITKQIAQSVVKYRKQFTKERSYPTLVYANKIFKMDKEARDYFSTPEATEGILAGVVLINSTFQATLANFFLTVSNPKIPTKVFTSEEKAIEWLSQFRENG